MKILRRTLFGNPILRQAARRLSREEVLSSEVQELIKNMYYTLETKKYGIGLAAPQVGRGLAVSVIAIRPKPWRPHAEHADLIIINPEIIATEGKRTGMWEGCISFGGGKHFPYAKALRYKKLRLRYYDKKGTVCEKDFVGLLAQAIQHETDHLNGVLFVDRVRDTKSYVTASEYNKRYREV